MVVEKGRKKSSGRLTRTRIDWADFSWNPVVGCLNDCPYCYARGFARRFSDYFPHGFRPSFFPERLDQPAGVKKPSWIFCGSMGDLFWHDHGTVRRVLETMERVPRHRFVVLTKTLARARAFVEEETRIPGNLWLGVSLDGKYVPTSGCGTSLESWTKEAAETLEVFLRHLDGRILVSFEPLLALLPGDLLNRILNAVGWVIVGGQTSPVRHPSPSWVEELVQGAKARGIPVFVKANAGPLWVGKYTERPEEV